ncbi:MAG: tRNA (guanosine(37)-N1)-methyltransferase TrmD [Dehalococcoidia bacterium]|nr:tRNA (guanosine(37)-N1)-methyltransferase TrmD [Dehalococcoidia bacterium]
MHFHVLTLFPQTIYDTLAHSMIGRAIEKGLVSVTCTDIRDYSSDKHGTADDYQYGGGPGMVMKPEPIFDAVDNVFKQIPILEHPQTPIVLLSPQGRHLNQNIINEFSKLDNLVLICGHYAGVDERVKDHLVTEEISIGDYVLTGGELGALIVIDSVSRFVTGVIGSEDNVQKDSITSGLLQHPVYTRPAEYRSYKVPEILRSGNHSDIDQWRRRESLKKTLTQRPDLLSTADLDDSDIRYLSELGYQG